MGKQQEGFTLIELMVTVAVLAIVVAMAAPSFNNQINNNRSVALAEEIITAINFARSEAVHRGRRVSICASDDGASCSGGWTDGWIVVADSAASDTAASPVINSAATDVLRRWEAPKGDPNLTVAQASGAVTFIRFTRLGTLGMPNGENVILNSSYSGCSGNSARQITIGLAGLIRTASTSCSG